MNTAECNAYAKINLSLDITGRREDGIPHGRHGDAVRVSLQIVCA